MTRKIGTAVLVVFLCTLAAGNDAWACSCGDAPIHASYSRADEVFTARVVAVWQDPRTKYVRLIARVRVLENFKGSASGEVIILSEELCGFPFDPDRDYLIYARSEPIEGLTTWLCSGTKALDRAARDLMYAQGMKQGRSGAVVYGRIVTESQARIVDYGRPVRLVLAGANGTFETVTSNRYFEFHFIPPGKYTVSAIDAEVVRVVSPIDDPRIPRTVVVPWHTEPQSLNLTLRFKE